MTTDHDVEEYALKKGKSLGSTVNSEMSTNKVVDFYLKLKHRVQLFFVTHLFDVRVSRGGMLIAPLILTIIAAAFNATVVVVAANIQLPSILYYNLVVALTFTTTILFCAISLWAFREFYRFKEAWSLVNTSTTLVKLQSAIDGTYGSLYNVLGALILLLIAMNAIVTLNAKWTLSQSDLGHYPCNAAKYDAAGMGNFTLTPDMLTGVADPSCKLTLFL